MNLKPEKVPNLLAALGMRRIALKCGVQIRSVYAWSSGWYIPHKHYDTVIQLAREAKVNMEEYSEND